MSRSYKRYPVVRQERVDKRCWNRYVRRNCKNIALRGSQYKRIQINFYDWHYRWTYDEAVKRWKPTNQYPTLDSYINYWKSCCIRK